MEQKQWWSPEYGFFGDFYMKGDDSNEGYLIQQKQTLRERTESEVNGIINLLDLKGKERILDCPCGYGRHSLMLGEKGFHVVGSDINPIHLKKAIGGKKHGLNVQFKEENMMDLKYNEEFDSVINMFYSFGFFDTDKENEKVLHHFYRALKKGGKFLMHTDVNIPRIESKKYREDEVRTLSDGAQLRIIDKYDQTTKKIEGTWIIKNGAKEERKDYSVRVYTALEFESLCKAVGFKVVKVYSDWEGSPYSEESEDMIVVATK